MGLKFLSQNFSHMMPLTCYYSSSGGLLVNFKGFMPKHPNFAVFLCNGKNEPNWSVFGIKLLKLTNKPPELK